MLSRSEFVLSAVAAGASGLQGAASVRLIYFGVASNLPVWCAIEKGFFSKESLTVTPTVTPGSVYMFQHLSAGDFDIAVTAFDNVVAYDEGQGEAALSSPADFVAFMGGDNGLLRVVARPEVSGYADLRGKTLAVDALTTGFAFVLRRMLEANGLREGDYTLAAAGGTGRRYAAITSGNTYAATILTTPFDFQAEAQGLRTLGTAIDVLGSYQGYCGVVRRAWAEANTDVLVRYIRGYLAALRWLYDPGNKTETIALIASNGKATLELAGRVYATVIDRRGGIVPSGEIDLKGVRSVLALRSRYGVPQKSLTDPGKYIDDRYYRRALG